MSKIATYLNEHLSGEVITEGVEIATSSVDGSVLLQKPEMVVNAANTSDIRKVARFCWQLAEKGHVLSITARGRGTDTTGGAIGKGIVISAEKYMNKIVGIDTRQRLIHVQAGASYAGVNMALSTHKGLSLPSESVDGTSGTVGGAISSGTAGLFSSRYGTVGSAIRQLEVVLASGEILQTGRISKRELSSKKGLHTMEGEIYRQVDNLITDNPDLIKAIGAGADQDTAGYSGIVDVKKKDGSFDLTPLFVGSQGSLGIITEAIMHAGFVRRDLSIALAAYAKMSDAQSASDLAVNAKAASVELIDGRILERADSQGKKRDFAPKEAFKGALVVAVFDDFSERLRDRTAKKFLNTLEKNGGTVHLSKKNIANNELVDIHSLIAVAQSSPDSGKVVPGAFRDIWLPAVRFDGFLTHLKKLEAEYSIQLPAYIDVKSGFVDLLPVFDMKKVSDRQKFVKLLTAIANTVHEQDGSLAGRGGDGRIKSVVSQKSVGDDVIALYSQIKKIFDPHGILNAEVKQDVSTKDLVTQLNAWCRSLS